MILPFAILYMLCIVFALPTPPKKMAAKSPQESFSLSHDTSGALKVRAPRISRDVAREGKKEQRARRISSALSELNTSALSAFNENEVEEKSSLACLGSPYRYPRVAGDIQWTRESSDWQADVNVLCETSGALKDRTPTRSNDVVRKGKKERNTRKNPSALSVFFENVVEVKSSVTGVETPYNYPRVAGGIQWTRESNDWRADVKVMCDEARKVHRSLSLEE
jgi:hypothetical protein